MESKQTFLHRALRLLGRSPSSLEQLDDPLTFTEHRRIIASNPFLRRVYLEFYQDFLDTARALADHRGAMLELGSGAGFLKEILPDVVTSEVCECPFADRVVHAEALPFEAGGLKAIFMLNVLHHLPDAEAFFREADRCLVPQGRIVMTEPYHSWLGRGFYKYLHHEPFDETMKGWQLPAGGRLSRSNQALPSIIFWHERARFESRFPRLRIVRRTPHSVLAYPLSGGMSSRPLVPLKAYAAVQTIDRALARLPRVFPLFQTIVLEKQPI